MAIDEELDMGSVNVKKEDVDMKPSTAAASDNATEEMPADAAPAVEISWKSPRQVSVLVDLSLS